MLDCKQALAELSNYLDDDVSSQFRRALEQHLAVCHRCSIVFDTTRKTLKIVSDFARFDVSLAASQCATVQAAPRVPRREIEFSVEMKVCLGP
jgi:predicted anti-sigma-YlaC factor YlaD